MAHGMSAAHASELHDTPDSIWADADMASAAIDADGCTCGVVLGVPGGCFPRGPQ